MIGLQGPAYLIRRPTTAQGSALVAFYRACGWSVVRDDEEGHFVVAGGSWGVKSVYVPRRHPSSADGALTPVVASRDLAATRSRLRAEGLSPEDAWDADQERRNRNEAGSTVEVRSPDGLCVGFRALLAPRAVHDTALPGVPPCPPDVAGLAVVRRRTGDPAAVARFYADVLQLEPVPGPVPAFHLGEGVRLEITSGGRARRQPVHKDDAPDALMVRVHGFEEVCDRLTGAGARWLGAPQTFWTGTSVAYLPDPEGVVIAVAQRTPYAPDVEDVAAHLRWLETNV